MEATYPVVLLAIAVAFIMQALKRICPGWASVLTKRLLVVVLAGALAAGLSAMRGIWPLDVETWGAEALALVAMSEMAYRWLVGAVLPDVEET